MVSDLLLDATELLAAGLTVVFIFLIILTGVTRLLVFLCPEQTAAETVDEGSTTQPHSEGATPAQLAAISIAVNRYRESRAAHNNNKGD